MVIELFAGVAINELKLQIVDFITCVATFESKFTSIQATMHDISPTVANLEAINRELDRPQNQVDMYKDLMNKGNELIRTATKVKKSWNPFKRYMLSKKLRDFQETFVMYCQIQGSIEQHRSTGQVAKDVRDLVELVKKEMSRISDKLDCVKCSGSTRSLTSSSSSSYFGYSGYTELPEIVVGLDLPLAELKAMLLDDNVLGTEQPGVVVVSAPPGCGKTVLVNMVCNDYELKDKFKDNILFVAVSKTFDIKIIVRKLFQQKGCLDRLLDVHSDEDAINQLRHLLNSIGGGVDKKPILLVLDDVWSPVFRSLVDKFKFKGIPGYKILITSRYDPHKFQPVYKLKLLDHEDAKKLFCYYAFPSGRSQHHDLDGYVDKIIKGCNGFPLALKVIGMSLGDKHEVFWKTTLTSWSLGQSTIFGSENEMLQKLKTSIDALDDENGMQIVRNCFMDLASFPEDQRIPAEALMDMWAELYNFKKEDKSTYRSLLELSDRNLLNLVPARKDDRNGVVSYSSGQFVTQHDMLRELAIYLTSHEDVELRTRLIMEIGENGFPYEWVDKNFNAQLLSISTDDSFTSSWPNIQFPEAKVLILNFRQMNYTLPQFMEHMKKLKVLVVTNYGFHPAEVQNFSAVACLSSLKRLRLEHVSMSTFAFQLNKLKKISLIMCKIGNALDDFAPTFPNLEEIEIEYCRDLVQLPAGVCDIVSLKKISIISCNELVALHEEIGNLTNLELLRLSSCTKLDELPEKIVSLQKLCLLDLSDCTNLNEMPIRVGELKSLKQLHMRGCSGLLELPLSVEEFRNLKVFCDKNMAPLWKYYDNVQVIVVKEENNLDWLHN